ncbi:twin arginine-targeting protein translocase TatB [Halomonas sp. 1513]|nr:Sec-independent protein translocase protein TatB [Halomonas sp. 1513]APX91537.1 twin arginine-targeting protein translocase TatB [Halomonas sp. 1513]
MPDIGFLELLILGTASLLVLGPERLPKAAHTAGLWIGKIKRTVSGMQREINAQLEAEELRQKLDEQQKKLDESLGRVKRDVERYAEPDSGTPPKGDAQHSPAAADQDEAPAASERLDKALASKARRDSVGSEQATPSSPPSDKDSPSR